MTFTSMIYSCSQPVKENPQSDERNFKFLTEQFADARILRYQVPGFEELNLNQKILVYYLSQAALCGRDIIYDQNFRHNLLIRNTLEIIYEHYNGDRTSEDFNNFVIYLKRVWFSNGIHHHYSTDKFLPEFPVPFLDSMIRNVGVERFPLASNQNPDEFIAEVSTLMFDLNVASKRVWLDPTKDLVLNSSSNFYEGLDQAEVEEFYRQKKASDLQHGRDTRISYGLNSRLVKEQGVIREEVYRVDGMYSQALSKITGWLEKSLPYAETPQQKEAIRHLIDFYKSGDLAIWDLYNISWVKDQNSLVDFVNGFIEVYGDPMALKGSWESIVNFKDEEATRRTRILSENAQFFEDNSPVDPAFRKKEVKGVTAKVITVAQLGGDCHPSTPIGINLPNSAWIRKEYGSKSVTIDNITYAYDRASQGNGFLEEFAFSEEEIACAKRYAYLAGNLTTDLHECLGHGSGQLLPGVTTEALKNYHSTIEEARADLFALYYIHDPEMVGLGLVEDYEVARAAYDNFMRNGLMTQLVRVQPGKNIEESHMRDRALIANWIFEHSQGESIVEKVTRNGKTYVHILDYVKLRQKFADLLRIIQRVTSEGDYEAAKNLVERYAVKVNPDLHREVLERYAKLNLAPYSGFINPEYTLVSNGSDITDVTIRYPEDFASQMIGYSRKYSFLPVR